MKKIYFKLLHNDLYYFKTANDTQHKGLHNLSGVFIEEKPKSMYEHIDSLKELSSKKVEKFKKKMKVII